MTVFLAISGTLYQNFSLQNVAPVLPNTSPAEIANLIAGTSSQTYKALSQEAKDLVIPQITDAMRNLWLFFLVGATLSFVLSVFLGVSLCFAIVLIVRMAQMLSRADLLRLAEDKVNPGWVLIRPL